MTLTHRVKPAATARRANCEKKSKVHPPISEQVRLLGCRVLAGCPLPVHAGLEGECRNPQAPTSPKHTPLALRLSGRTIPGSSGPASSVGCLRLQGHPPGL